MLSIIAAIGNNRELGKNNKLLWDIPEDMAWFREKTKGHPVIMGRYTFESIGHPLPNRMNVVVTRDPHFMKNGVTVVHSLEEAITQANIVKTDEMFIIGGANLYIQALPIADRLYITEVDASFPDADTFFPQYVSRFTKEEFKKTLRSSTGYTLTFKILSPDTMI